MVALRPGWRHSEKGNPTRVVNDTGMTVYPHPEDPDRWSFVVGGIFAPPATSFVSVLSAQEAAEAAYAEHVKNGTLLSSYRSFLASNMEQMHYSSRRSFARSYRRTAKPGDVLPRGATRSLNIVGIEAPDDAGLGVQKAVGRIGAMLPVKLQVEVSNGI